MGIHAKVDLSRRRALLAHMIGLSGAGLASMASRQSLAAGLNADQPAPVLYLGAAWRGPRADDPQRLGMLAIDWEQARIRIVHARPLPSRAHGLVATADGGLIAQAARFGAWLLRLDAQGQVVARANLLHEPGGRRCAGHVWLSADQRWLYATELDPHTCAGWVVVRDPTTLALQAAWPLPGADPHQGLVDDDGQLMIAIGGVLRTADDRKRDLHRMDSSLLRLDAGCGAVLGQWRLPDPRLSVRHLAWADVPVPQAHAALAQPASRMLGIALQAEHDVEADRQAAPLLAVWDGQGLHVPQPALPHMASTDARIRRRDGYAGDITATPEGFVISSQNAGLAWSWHADRPQDLQLIADLQQVCALASDAEAGATLMASARGVAQWSLQAASWMLAWPEPMVLDNHWVVLRRA